MSKPIDLRLNKNDIALTIEMLTYYRKSCEYSYEITSQKYYKTQSMACSKLIKKFMFVIDKGGAE